MSIAKDVWTRGEGGNWAVVGLGGFRRFRRNPPLGCMHLVLRNTDDRLNGTPLALHGYRTKKTAAMAYLSMF